jgi:hypothetical protein
MAMTERQLRQIIKEEAARIVREAEHDDDVNDPRLSDDYNEPDDLGPDDLEGPTWHVGDLGPELHGADARIEALWHAFTEAGLDLARYGSVEAWDAENRQMVSINDMATQFAQTYVYQD